MDLDDIIFRGKC